MNAFTSLGTLFVTEEFVIIAKLVVTALILAGCIIAVRKVNN